MKPLDWIVLVLTLLIIILYGVYKSRSTRDLDGYFLSNRSMPWYIILLSIIGTQASAVTFLSAPGQAYTDGMRFVQYYFGLPLAAIVICVSFLPVFTRLKVYTAYEFLEKRFNGRVRIFTSLLFLIQRGISTGISIYAPSIILSVLFGWNIYLTNIVMGGMLIIYTVSGGARAVAYTQQLQFVVIMAALFLAGYYIVQHLPPDVGFTDAVKLGGKMGKFNVITTGFEKGSFDWGDRYNIFSGIIGGFFLLLSYFGADQSQVGRYLTGKSIRESRMGLLMNGVVKIPMQFLILLLGVLVFSFYQFFNAPAFFNKFELNRLEQSAYSGKLKALEQELATIENEKNIYLREYVSQGSDAAVEKIRALQLKVDGIRESVKELVAANGGDANDTNYIFLRFVTDYLPSGLVGLVIAMIFLASWGSIAAAINSLASSTMIDFHKRFRPDTDTARDFKMSRIYTLLWGIFCIVAAMLVSNRANSLIEAVNKLGSLFYGTILGVFLVAFYAKKVQGRACFLAAVLTEAIIITLFLLSEFQVISLGFLWLNVIGALLVWGIALLLEFTLFKPGSSSAAQPAT